MAAKQQEWEIAIRNFQEARKTVPDAPEVFYNLGLAESKIRGRELRAIAWFGAYLSATPNAPNAAAVKDKIAELQIKNEGNTSRLIKQVQDASGQISGDNSWNLGEVAGLWAGVGDITSATKTVDLIHNAYYKRFAQCAIAEAQISIGDITGAQKTLALAKKTAELIQDVYEYYALTAIAEAQRAVGDIASAKDTLASALKAADYFQDAFRKSYAQRSLAEVQIRAGDIAGAQKSLASAQKNADLISGASDKRTEQVMIFITQAGLAKAQVMAGDIVGAQKTVDFIQDEDLKRRAKEIIAEAQGKADNTNAPKPIRQSTSDAQAPIQPVLKVSDWLEKLDDRVETEDCPLNAGPFLNLACYLKSLPPSDDPQKVFESLHKTAEKIVAAQNVIAGMLKQQAVQPGSSVDETSAIPNEKTTHTDGIVRRESTLGERVEEAEKQLVVLSPGFQPSRSESTLEEHVVAMEERLRLLKKSSTDGTSTDHLLLALEQRVYRIETSIANPESGGSAIGPKTWRSKEYTYQGRQISLEPEMVFDITGKVESASVFQYKPDDSYFHVSVVLKDNVKQALKEFSEQNIGREVGLIYKGKLVSVAVLQSSLSTGSLQISGDTRPLKELMKFASELSGK